MQSQIADGEPDHEDLDGGEGFQQDLCGDEGGAPDQYGACCSQMATTLTGF
ncbi:hypothetical protein SDC9_202427 [bioreactor metagenome]|uniref:Uncharacterized protein n=1 Tax=bioreactor metagenome TaxID=1076179 RepID=A0A645IV45_9ZZZZ